MRVCVRKRESMRERAWERESIYHRHIFLAFSSFPPYLQPFTRHLTTAKLSGWVLCWGEKIFTLPKKITATDTIVQTSLSTLAVTLTLMVESTDIPSIYICPFVFLTISFYPLFNSSPLSFSSTPKCHSQQIPSQPAVTFLNAIPSLQTTEFPDTVLNDILGSKSQSNGDSKIVWC